MVESYNHTVNRTVDIPPAEVTWGNQSTVSKSLYGRKGPIKSCKFSPGDSATQKIRVITILPNSEQSYKGKVKTHKHTNRHNQTTTGKL